MLEPTTRRQFLHLFSASTTGAILAACAAQAPSAPTSAAKPADQPTAAAAAPATAPAAAPVAKAPAAQAGLQQRDVITAINGQPLQGESGLAQAINAHKVGDTVTLTLLRGTTSQQVQLTLGAMPQR